MPQQPKHGRAADDDLDVESETDERGLEASESAAEASTSGWDLDEELETPSGPEAPPSGSWP
jgi:hypothetical protein